ncbi:MAG: hypothetical protein U0821_26970 [Chloroflexota bacterium]
MASNVTVVVDDSLFDHLRSLDRQTISGPALPDHLSQAEMSTTAWIYRYLESGGVDEVLLPLHRLAQMTAMDEQDDVRRAFNAVRGAAPKSAGHQPSMPRVLESAGSTVWRHGTAALH